MTTSSAPASLSELAVAHGEAIAELDRLKELETEAVADVLVRPGDKAREKRADAAGAAVEKQRNLIAALAARIEKEQHAQKLVLKERRRLEYLAMSKTLPGLLDRFAATLAEVRETFRAHVRAAAAAEAESPGAISEFQRFVRLHGEFGEGDHGITPPLMSLAQLDVGGRSVWWRDASRMLHHGNHFPAAHRVAQQIGITK